MAERGILFSAPMVRALLDGSKTQTRRVVKLPYANPLGQWEPTVIGGQDGGRTAAGGTVPEQGAIWLTRTGECLTSPYGQPGDRLWVRERWRVGAWRGPAHDRSIDHWFAVDYEADGFARKEWITCAAAERLAHQSVDDAVKAGCSLGASGRYSWAPGASPCRWRHARFMPRAASRILLEITGVRVERLQDIREADARAEGVTIEDRHTVGYCAGEFLPPSIRAYRDLWESINGASSWDANPWVWALEFKRVTP